MFKDYDQHKVGVLSTRIEDMDALFLNYWLSKFVVEVAKKSGEGYPPKTAYGIACGIRQTGFFYRSHSTGHSHRSLELCTQTKYVFTEDIL